MTKTAEKIATGLERAFARYGFAEPGVDLLREEAGVSLRTLYKYCPSRDAMVMAALEQRHARYLARITEALPEDPEAALMTVLERVAAWMEEQAPQGCLFHAAVAAAPENTAVRDLLLRHKTEVAERIGHALGLAGRYEDVTLLLEGLTQAWPIHGRKALDSAKRLAVPWLAERRAHDAR